MPPAAKITKDMIIKAGVETVRELGEECLNVRIIANRLGCSTQPIMYHYKTVGDLKRDIYKAADELHSQYLMQPCENAVTPMMSIGLNYIRFADTEKGLFRFLFQSGSFVNTGFEELMSSPETEMFIQPLCAETKLSPEQGREAFRALFLCVHGIASLLANNSIKYDEKKITETLTGIFMGTIGYLGRGE